MQHRGNELHLLRHTLGEVFHFLVPPAANFESFEPSLEAGVCLARGESFELRQVHTLFADFHFLVEAAFFGQVANMLYIARLEGLSAEEHLALIGPGDLVDDADEGCFAGAIGTEQSEYGVLGHGDTDIIERSMFGVGLMDVSYFKGEHGAKVSKKGKG
jgi:hypothetical protein